MNNAYESNFFDSWEIGRTADQFLIAARRADELVSRKTELSQLRKAIFHPKARSGAQVVFLKGGGGLGKSRLVEEMLFRTGNKGQRAMREGLFIEHADWDWCKGCSVIVADLLDFSDTALHAPHNFMRALRDRLLRERPALDFYAYDSAFREYQQKILQGPGFGTIETAARFAEEAFLKCYAKAAEQFDRIVLTLDTCEKLSYSHKNWLVNENLLKRQEVPYVSHWLIAQVNQGTLPKTTLVLVGREKEGKEFFDLVREGLDQPGHKGRYGLEEIALSGFSFAETCQYFKVVAGNWTKAAGKNTEEALIARDFAALAKNEDLMAVLWRYTGGQPVRLALYSDLMVEAGNPSERLFDTVSQAKDVITEEMLIEVAKGADGDALVVAHYHTVLANVQEAIEASFIDMLFSRAGMRAAILNALARAPRGLDTTQLFYVLFEKSPLDQAPRKEELEPIEEEIKKLKRLTIVKERPGGRLGLQDEIYHIYARVMRSSQLSIEDEKQARHKMYLRLRDWARIQSEKCRQERRQFFEADAARLILRSPVEAFDVVWPSATPREQEERQKVLSQIETWYNELIHYRLLADVQDGINPVLFELGYNKSMASHPDDFSSMEEVYQVLFNPDLLGFLDLEPSKAALQRGETQLDVLTRLMRQAETVRWLARFIIKRDFARTREYYQKLNEYVDGIVDPKERASWKHTLSQSDRVCWYEYHRILEGEDIEAAIESLEQVASRLEQLAAADKSIEVFPGEMGFIGHPGLARAKRVLALVYNNLGYGCVTIGKLKKSQHYYGRALMLMRSIEYRFQMATILNNLSRLLSDKGRARARRICLDALDLRKDVGELSPIAYSINTLALIDNDQLRPDLSWREAATALALFRFIGDRRGMGLAMIQLGEALRRFVANEKKMSRLAPETPNAIFDTAERALEEAVRIFTKGSGPEGSEEVRLIEARIELGCLLRDRITYEADPDKKQHMYISAIRCLDQAIELCKDYPFARLKLDATVNRAWTHYAGGLSEQAEDDLADAEGQTLEETHLSCEKKPDPDNEASYVYQQLSKIYSLRGKMAMDGFNAQVKKIEQGLFEDLLDQRHMVVAGDTLAQENLKMSAYYYAIGLGYAQVFSPRSSALSAIYDALYEYLKGFNDTELESFYIYQSAATKELCMKDIKVKDLGDLGEFLYECVGNFEGNTI
jgi:hypothetical protein